MTYALLSAFPHTGKMLGFLFMAIYSPLHWTDAQLPVRELAAVHHIGEMPVLGVLLSKFKLETQYPVAAQMFALSAERSLQVEMRGWRTSSTKIAGCCLLWPA
jgi:hypothetical protein